MVYDVAIIGAGMAGASLAAQLAPHLRVIMFEAEDFPGYHATGRSAAFWSETYGGPLVQPLTSASGPFLDRPPVAFAEQSFLTSRGALMIGRDQDAALAAQFCRDFEGSGVALDTRTAENLARQIPGLRSGWSNGVWEASTADIDVGALHQAYLRAARKAGAALHVRSPVRGLERSAGGWTIAAGDVRLSAARIVNAAGAWATSVAEMAGATPIPIRPMRRTMVQLRLGQEVSAALPLIVDLSGRFYFKPEGTQRVWLSPHDETPTAPCDAAPDKEDVARAIARFQSVVDWPVAAVERSWAGLRSFAPDRVPVIGEDPDCRGFFWCAGQGGAGIQTSPAIAALLTSEILGTPLTGPYAHLDPALYAPARCVNSLPVTG